ncbi:MAG TPA: putative toxin-antitoxin system toxin component, PIN family [Povalibacter sp.]|uniref:putative toxin-antitoxin system toxin component, PIN family n=1 Tax=Povalibacter sp. TaxID=1962978 RepID=UPI002B830168|nr:putative toxin-antitoxin system toxin component, PIN family [Povalibacter sp.]HMN46023.1 putative toxin-antitoxin system toxin component, PIN family [Povalibacter sp.]
MSRDSAPETDAHIPDAPSGTPPRLVLDTNIVLDCFVFRDRAAHHLTTAIETRRAQALVHQHAIDELERVLSYPQCRLAAVEQRRILDRYLAAAILAPMPDGFSREEWLLPAGFPRCRDRDDQPFLALAYHARADALITKDRALLKLRRKARRFGVAIVPPLDLELPRCHDMIPG